MAPSDLRDPRHLLAARDRDEGHGEDPSSTAGAATGAVLASEVVGASKLASYDQGVVRKSRREREAEAQQLKAKEQEQLAAKAYNDFMKDFGGGDDDDDDQDGAGHASSHSWPRRGMRGKYSAGKGFVSAGGGQRYNPLQDRPPVPAPASAAPTPSTSSLPSVTGAPTAPRAMRLDRPAEPVPARTPAEENRPSVSTTKSVLAPGKKRRDGDSFLEQLKREQAEREERLKQKADRMGSSVTALAARENAPVLTGSYDTGDPLTTNIHVSPLPQNVTEDTLGMFFARYGAIGSVKIMWPRLEPGATLVGRRQLSGFVAFMRRPDAEKAAKELDGVAWGGTVLKLSWGKPVPIPTRAVIGLPKRSRRRATTSSLPASVHISISFTITIAFAIAEKTTSVLFAGRRARTRAPRMADTRGQHRGKVFDDDRPQDTRAWQCIRARVEGEGEEQCEVRLFPRREVQLPSYHYFKMLMDRHYRAPLPAKFDDAGPAEVYSSDTDEDSENERVLKGRLGTFARKRFEALLRTLKSTRGNIARGMAFALEHADAASFIVDLLIASLMLEATPVPRKIARLHLVSDILHNSSAPLPNAWMYRSTFEERLPVVFDHLGEIYKSFPGRMKAEQFRLQISSIVDVWERDWMLFETRVFDDFRRRLAGLSEHPVEKVTVEPEVVPSPEPEAPISASAHWAPVSSAFKPATVVTSGPIAPPTPRAPSPIPGLAAPPPVSDKKSQIKFAGFKTSFTPTTGLPQVSVKSTDTVELGSEAHLVGIGLNVPSPAAATSEADDGDAMEIEGVDDDDDDDVDGVPWEGPGAEADDVDGTLIQAADVDGSPINLEVMDGAPFDADADDMFEGPPTQP
ncbi:BQ2448_1342 [Microbotryum intermedium]|uniref:BQ2448_1342 protein n=1 Tax=Microbotryum intermedium TaxID=269621 RepID=A0A238FFM6_9BASI|nr:BQ2448_1342 [Microbotryum intermedium]